ncbi:unnamed protein product [Eruca vesicaria subsp. sativa]|uniref:Uncharacterized protein n=1 Tax=Eruca vesicaria subsp. sativa TaxID=29727 RepID=A0ABC8LQI7_ERUVS|nr:unnamed protein product [Eruca vesicaria subsp. sativa]
MFTGCLRFFKVMFFMKKQSKKEDKPLKADGLTKVGEKDAENSVGVKRRRRSKRHPTDWACAQCSNVIEHYPGGSYEGASSSPMTNEFNKVKTFDFREVAKATSK